MALGVDNIQGVNHRLLQALKKHKGQWPADMMLPEGESKVDKLFCLQMDVVVSFSWTGTTKFLASLRPSSVNRFKI
jgi:hypothetical protein